MQKSKNVQIWAETLKKLLPQGLYPKIGLVLGTGLGKLAGDLTQGINIPYEKLQDFPRSTAPSHRGTFATGRLAGVPVIIQQGRCHLYEGRTPAEVCAGVNLMADIGVSALILTNAAGAVNPRFAAGSLMLIEDHINFTGQSPLTGPNDEAKGPRFPDMSRPYDPAFIGLAEKTALALGIRLEKGVYFCVPGPQLETRAETRAYRLLGGDAVGMSTALEVIAARHRGMRVLGLSCLSNQNLPDCMAETDISEILQAAENAGADLMRVISAVLPQMLSKLEQSAAKRSTAGL